MGLTYVLAPFEGASSNHPLCGWYLILDTESDTQVHRHLVVFSYLVLKKYLQMIGFSKVQGYGFGLYPLPNIFQPIFEKIDPYHCHQMVFIAYK